MASSPFHYGGTPTGPAVASAVAPVLTEGSIVKLSTDLSGNLRTTAGGGGGGGTSSAFGEPFPANGTAAGFIDPDGNMAAGNVDASGNLLVAGTFTSATPTSNTATDPTQTTVGTSAATALAAGARKGLSIQNQGTTIIYLLLGGGTPSSSKYTVALPACGVNNDGSSAPYTGPPGVVWTGAVQWISSGVGGLATAVELT